MKLRELESFLSAIKPFAKPKVQLEQYATDAHIAARMIYTASTVYDDIIDKRIIDLGCGCGMLSLGAIYAGAGAVLGVDIDQDALNQCRENMQLVEMDEDDGLELLCASVSHLPTILKGQDPFDVAILNPPFGTKNNEGIDMEFLWLALQTAPVAYSMHKTSTREFIQKKAISWNVKVEVLAQLKFLIPRQFKFHKEERVYVDVDLIRVERGKIGE